MSNVATIPQVTAAPAVPSAERNHVLYLSRSSPPPSRLPRLIPTLPSILSDSMTHLQLLDFEISAVTAKLRALEQNRSEWSAHQSCCQFLLAPIRSLPTELLQLIFENLVLYDKSYHPYDDFTASRTALAAIDSVSRVSHLWRCVALACPRVWGTIRAGDIAHAVPTYIQQVVLPRTIQCGLNLAVHGERDYGTEFLLSHSHLVQRLSILEAGYDLLQTTCSQGWANLTHLEGGSRVLASAFLLCMLTHQ